MSNKVLFILKVPPPVHGSSVMNKYIMDSETVTNGLESLKVGQSISTSLQDVGRFSIGKFFKVLKNYVEVFKKIRSFKPDLIYFAISPLGIAFLKDAPIALFAKYKNIPIVYHLHVKGLQNQSKKYIYNTLYERIFKDSYVIILSSYLKKDIEHLPFKKHFIIGNGVVDVMPSVRNIVENKNEFVITYLSNFILEKGVMDVMSLIIELNRSNVQFKFNFIGKDKDVTGEILSELIVKNNLSSKLIHLGSAYGNTKNELLANTSILVFPTFYHGEAFSLVILEALQLGIPVITTAEGGIPDLIKHEINGFLVNKNDLNKMKEHVLNLYNDKSLYHEMSSNARRMFLENHTLEKFEKNINSALIEILEQEKSIDES